MSIHTWHLLGVAVPYTLIATALWGLASGAVKDAVRVGSLSPQLRVGGRHRADHPRRVCAGLRGRRVYLRLRAGPQPHELDPGRRSARDGARGGCVPVRPRGGVVALSPSSRRALRVAEAVDAHAALGACRAGPGRGAVPAARRAPYGPHLSPRAAGPVRVGQRLVHGHHGLHSQTNSSAWTPTTLSTQATTNASATKATTGSWRAARPTPWCAIASGTKRATTSGSNP